MKKFKNFKPIPAITIGVLLLISAITFPVLAERFQAKGIEKGAMNLEANSLRLLDVVVETKEEETETEDIITMTEEEEKIFDDIVHLMQKSTLLTALENRELSETESNRMIELRKKFMVRIIRDEKILPIGEDLEKPYYNPEDETYYYPEAEMTDEQLLQIIDFNAKRDITFSKLYEEYIQNVMENSDIKISEEEAIKSAKDAVERIYNVDLDNMKSTCHFVVDEYHNEKSWRIIFEPKNLEILKEQEKLYWMYFVEADIYSGKTYWIDSYYSNQTDETKESVKVDLNNIDGHKRIAEEVLKNRLNAKNIEFQKAYIRKPGNLFKEDIINKTLNLVYKAEDRYIEFEFLYGSKRMVSLFFFDDPVKLNERVNEREQESIGSIN